jgi:hypothetical protein
MTETDLDKFEAVLENQRESGITSGDWPRLEYTLDTSERYVIRVVIEALQVGFVFSRRGRFIGAYNWKQ